MADRAPQVQGLPILGSLLSMMTDFPRFVQETAPSYGDIVRFSVGGGEIHVISHPDYLQYVLRDNHKDYIRGGAAAAGLDRVIGQGLIVLDGEQWLTERRLMQPYFHRKYFPSMLGTMNKTIDEQLQYWQENALNKPLDLAKLVRRMTINIFTRTMFSMGLDDDTIIQMGDAYDNALRHSMKRARYDWALPSWMVFPGDGMMKQNVGFVNEHISRIIQLRRQSNEEHADLLAFLISATDEETGAKMNDQQLLDEIKTLTVAGFDTTSGTLLWAFDVLSTRPDVVAKIAEEARRVLTDTEVTMETVAKLEYTRWVIDEVLRLHPVSWVNNRFAIHESEIGGYHVPANTMVMFPIMRIQRDPRFWDDPLTFKPERWQEKDGGAKHRFAYIPFGAGPRVCMGEQFALLEATLTLAKIILHFDIKPTKQGFETIYDFTMQPKTYPVTISARNGITA